MPHVNWLAVLAAALSSFVLGGLWYSALFAKAWQAAAGVSDEAMRGGNKAADVRRRVRAVADPVGGVRHVPGPQPGAGAGRRRGLRGRPLLGHRRLRA